MDLVEDINSYFGTCLKEMVTVMFLDFRTEGSD